MQRDCRGVEAESEVVASSVDGDHVEDAQRGHAYPHRNQCDNHTERIREHLQQVKEVHFVRFNRVFTIKMHLWERQYTDERKYS